MFCRKCGKELSDGTKFCDKCGTQLSNSQTQETAAQVKEVPPVSQDALPQEPPKKKKGCLKIGLITVGVIILIVIIASLAGGNDSSDSKDTSSSDSTTTEVVTDYNSYEGGTYKIGTDMPAGEYLVIANGYNYIQVASDSSGELDSIVMNDNFMNRIYITVSDGQYLEFDGKAIPAEDAPDYELKGDTYPAGMYKVGKDIPAGEYKIKATGDIGYYEVTTSSVGTLDAISTNENLDGETYQTISDGQYIKLSGAEIIPNK